jgi:Ankyrin repeats (3 copies)
LIRSRGYSTQRYSALESGYYYKPSAFQKASYDLYLVRLVQQNRQTEIRQIFECGISPNPCNNSGESLLHTICHSGNASILQVMLDAQSDPTVVDEYGRTPLHHACQSTKKNIFPVIELLLRSGGGYQQRMDDSSCMNRMMVPDPTLFYLTDCRGSLPLQYVARNQWGIWIQWLEAHKDIYWPRQTRRKVDDEFIALSNPILRLPPQSRTAPVPTDPLPPALTKLLVSGRITPLEVKILQGDSDYSNDMYDSEYDSMDSLESFDNDNVITTKVNSIHCRTSSRRGDNSTRPTL